MTPKKYAVIKVTEYVESLVGLTDTEEEAVSLAKFANDSFIYKFM